MAKPVPLILLPGLGGDGRMFGPQAAEFEQMVVPPWIVPEWGESLPDYAARLAETIPCPSDGPWVLGGVSLGGMMAYELAQHLRPSTLVLIATCRTREGIARYRPLVPLACRLPNCAISLAKWLSPAAVHWFSDWPADVQRLGIDMFKAADPRFMRWALGALLTWEPSPLPNLPILQIHGRHDRAIPVRGVQPDKIVDDGGHLINLTHSKVVNAFLAEALNTTRIPTV